MNRDPWGNPSIRPYGTKVRNPCVQGGRSGYSACSMCGRLFTHLGISRHWDRCPERKAKQ